MSSNRARRFRDAQRARVAIKATRIQLDEAFSRTFAATSTPTERAHAAEAYEIAAAALHGLDRTMRGVLGMDPMTWTKPKEEVG